MTLCFLYLVTLLGIFQPTQSVLLRCYKGTSNEYLETSMDNPLPLLNSSCLDQGLPTVFFTFGYKGRTNGRATTALLDGYLATKKRNVILVDWEEEASSGWLGNTLGYALSAVPNAIKIGMQLGDALVKLTKSGLNMTQVHLIGHSLGAHLMGYAGRRTRENGFNVARITGLDPARDLFEGIFALRTGLDRTCGKFVDIIHSDPGGSGITKSMGTVDFWPNYSQKNPSRQPGCKEGIFERFSAEDLCKHDRAWVLFVESLSSPTAFPSKRAPDYLTWLESDLDSAQANFMGDLTNTLTEGNFYLRTKGRPPYGMDSDGMYPSVQRTRRQRSYGC